MASKTDESGGDGSGLPDDAGEELVGALEGAGTATKEAVLPDWLTDFKSIAMALLDNPGAWILSALTALTLEQAIKEVDEHGVTTAFLDQLIWQTILLPVAEAIWAGGMALLGAIIFLIYGGDGRIGIHNDTMIGLADLPFIFTGPAGTIISVVSDAINSIIAEVNGAIVQFIQPLGIAAPPVLAVFWTLFVSVAIWAAWTALKSIDIPAIRVVPALKSVAKPLVNIIKGLT